MSLRRFAALSETQFLSIYLPAFILALGTGIAAPALPVYVKSFDLTFGVASMAITAQLAGSAAGNIPTGYLIDRVGARRVVIAGPLLTAVAQLLVAQAHSFPELLAYRFIGGWATQMWMLGRLTMITQGGGNRRGRQISGLVGMDTVGRLLGPALGGFLAASFDVRAPFVAHGLLALVAAVPTFYGARIQAQAQQASSAEQVETRRLTRPELLNVHAVALFLSQLTANLTRGALFNGTLLFYAAFAYDASAETLGIVAGLVGLFGVPITFSVGHLMDRYGRRATIIPGQTLLGLSLGVMAMTAFAGVPFAWFVGVMVLVEMSQAVTSGSMQTLGSDAAPPHARGQFLGIWRLVADLGTFLSPVMFAAVAEAAGYGWSFISLSLCGFGTALLVARRVHETVAHRQGTEAALLPSPAAPAPVGKG